MSWFSTREGGNDEVDLLMEHKEGHAKGHLDADEQEADHQLDQESDDEEK